MAMYEFNPDDADRFAIQIGIPVRRHGRELIFKKCPYCGAYEGYHYLEWNQDRGDHGGYGDQYLSYYSLEYY